MAKSTGLGLLELPTVFESLQPDIVLSVADRFETIATAIAAAYMNLPLAHTQGGEVSGSIDESVRHAVTKLAHLHFPATELSRQRVIAMGEDPDRLQRRLPVNRPRREGELRHAPGGPRDLRRSRLPIDPEKPFLLMMQHPVTTEYGRGFEQINATLNAVTSLGMQTLVFWPNVDAGSEEVAKGIRLFREAGRDENFHFFRNLPPETFVRLMAHCSCIVGNSSAALREGAFLGTPAVTLGSRQQNRECGQNVVRTSNDADEIADAIRDQMRHGPYERDDLFGDGTAGERIAEILAVAEPRIQKKLHYDVEELAALGG